MKFSSFSKHFWEAIKIRYPLDSAMIQPLHHHGALQLREEIREYDDTVVSLLTTSMECKDISILTRTEKYLWRKRTYNSFTEIGINDKIFHDNKILHVSKVLTL
jgi:hypothetical protein